MKRKVDYAVAGILSVAVVSAARAAVALDDFETNPTLPQRRAFMWRCRQCSQYQRRKRLTPAESCFRRCDILPGHRVCDCALNVYGTADFANGLPEKLSIGVNAANPTTEISFALFNGEVFTQSYTINAFNGTTLVGMQQLANVPTNFSSGYGLIDITAPAEITNVTITPDGNPSAWDFLIDTIAFNQSITSVITTPPGNPPPQQGVQPAEPPQPAEPVQVEVTVDSHGKEITELETETVEVNFGDDRNAVKGSVAPPPVLVPEPASVGMIMTGVLGLIARRRARMNRGKRLYLKSRAVDYCAGKSPRIAIRGLSFVDAVYRGVSQRAQKSRRRYFAMAINGRRTMKDAAAGRKRDGRCRRGEVEGVGAVGVGVEANQGLREGDGIDVGGNKRAGEGAGDVGAGGGESGGILGALDGRLIKNGGGGFVLERDGGAEQENLGRRR